MALREMPKVGDKVRYLGDRFATLTRDKTYEVIAVDEYGDAIITDDTDVTLDIAPSELDEYELVAEESPDTTDLIANLALRVHALEQAQEAQEDDDYDISEESFRKAIADFHTAADEAEDKRNEGEEMSEYVSEKRHAKPGERIVVVAPGECTDHEQGDTIQTKGIAEGGVLTINGDYLSHDEYEVLPAELPDFRYPTARALTDDERAQYEEGGGPAYQYIEGAHGFNTPGKRKAAEPDKPEQIRAVCDEIGDLLIRKNHDYGDSFAQQYAKYGLFSAIVRMDDKMRRLETLASGEQAQVAESIEDTLADLAGYALLALVEARAEGGR